MARPKSRRNPPNDEGLDAVRLMIELRRWADEVRRREMDRARKRLGTLTQEQMEVTEAATAAIVNKLLHTPTVQIRQLARDGDGAGAIGLLRTLLDVLPPARPGTSRSTPTHTHPDHYEASMIVHDAS